MISIIIPVYNEESTIRETLGNLLYNNDVEVIVVDGESNNRTLEFAKQYPVRVIKSVKNRAAQLNEGARIVKGDKFLFLHTDCRLDSGCLEKIESCLTDSFAGGCFTQKIDSKKFIYRFIETSENIRAKVSRVFYGDQAIFVRRDAFFKIGGFDKIDLFEDVIFSQKLKKLGKTCVLKKKVYASARRWERQGVIKTTLINWLISLGFFIGISPDVLKKIYTDIREG